MIEICFYKIVTFDVIQMITDQIGIESSILQTMQSSLPSPCAK